MAADAYSSVALNNLRQWQRSRSTLRSRSPSSSSQSSTNLSRPATPSDSVHTHLHPQFWQRPANSPNTLSVDEHLRRKSPTELEIHSPSSSRSSLEDPHLQPDDYQLFLERSRRRARTQTITPATVRRALQPDSDRMRITLPGSNQRDSTSSSDSRPSSSSDSVSTYDEELGGIPARHPLRNRVDSKGSSLLFNDAESLFSSPTKSLRVRTHTYRSESPSSVSTLSPPRSYSSLRLKPKKSHSNRGAMTLFKSLASPPNLDCPLKHEDIEFDWAEQRRRELERRAILVEQRVKEVRLTTENPSQGESEVQCLPDSGDMETQQTTSIRPRSWELTSEEQALRIDQRMEEKRRFIFKDLIWVNQSYLSAHSRDAVPYPFAYDNVNIQTDRHSHALVRQLLCGRPSIHDLSTKPPAVVLDLGCGDGTWLLEAAQYWKNTLFFGLDLQILHPSPQQLQADLGEPVDNIKFTYHNFLLDMLPYRDGKFDLVRMANLKWAIPEDKWDFVFQEVNRVLRRGGWVEIIDDDHLLDTFPQDTLPLEQDKACNMLEPQFMDMLQARNLLLNTSGGFMDGKLRQWFNASQKDKFPITISKARPVSGDIHGQEPIPQKASKLMGFGLDSAHEKHRSAGSTKSRSRSGSVSSGVSYSSGVSWSSSRDAERTDDRSDEQHGSLSEVNKHRTYQPLGLEVHPGHFIPFPPAELNAHAIRNMQSILASKEAIRAHNLKKCPELGMLEIKDDLLPEERQQFDELSWEWKDRQRAFDDAFWDFETAMLKRLNLPQRCFDLDDENDHHHKSVSVTSRPLPQRTASVLSKRHKDGDDPPSPISSNFPASSHTPVRLIRVYSGWK